MTTDTSDALSRVPSAVWKKLATLRIYFGHQSVGDNIILGMRQVLSEHPEIGLRIQEKPELMNPTRPLFVHSYIGDNENPLTKNKAFAEAVRDTFGGRVDMAFFKYCFVDVSESSDVGKLFQEYKRTMGDLRHQFPGVLFVHFTVPLMTVQTGWRASLKEMIGRPVGGYADNIKRNEFNDLLRKEYAGTPLFDIAKLEAIRPDRSSNTFRHQGQAYASLAPEYSRDGGHLNEVGRRYIAEEFLLFLARQASRGMNLHTAD